MPGIRRACPKFPENWLKPEEKQISIAFVEIGPEQCNMRIYYSIAGAIEAAET